ncbi:short chain dehydrogenase reductase [Grosmannia clavigera kw1407]|uniref:Short chain dehydrogenase reductase n=1 Tax=Grosmannia clavigera (strain kw1407 / UAMH 11150) TaxID=655863 RepID=F0XQP6_GROCL|nr:short chain dehydrogenase reductase [Grosmannia clavigera kw1407]EFW99920.1 short chain dehydrogenase reductase [Grosmannia clavigera kw1407]
MDLKADRSLKGKVAIVTGAGCAGEGFGNGRATAYLLAEDGATVICVDRQLDWAQKTVEYIETYAKGTAIACAGDVTSEEDANRIIQTAIDTFGRLDILVNNVGVGGCQGSAVTLDVKAWERDMTINVSSMVIMSKYAIPAMLKNEHRLKGSIVNISSVAALNGGMKNLLYPTSKGAITAMTKNMAYQHGKQGIRVNCVCPGSVWTPLLYEHPVLSGDTDLSDKVRKTRAEGNMLGTEGYGWDSGYAVRWLSSPEARWVTGVVLPVDAGLSATIQLEVPETKD